MTHDAATTEPSTGGDSLTGVVADWSADKQVFPVPWGKAMMWIFLVSDTFIFTCFLTGYMNVRMSTTVNWPNPSEVFGLNVGGHDVPLLLIAIMTMVLITSSGTMAMAVNYGYRRFDNTIMIACIVLLIALVQLIQFSGDRIVRALTH